jgi:hypothetical protein
MHKDYELEIVSHHKDFDGKTLRKYYVDGIEHVGAYGEEPFSIVFKNNTNEDVQLKISLDGTDILTGEKADTKVSPKMWLANARSSLVVKAFPEDNNGGARFIFTGSDNSVAAHTHGDLSSRGIIAVAVYVEGTYKYDWNKQVPRTVNEPWGRLNNEPLYKAQNYSNNSINYKGVESNTLKSSGPVRRRSIVEKSFDGVEDLSDVGDCAPGVAGGSGFETMDCERERATVHSNSVNLRSEKLVAIGAGEHVEQKLKYVKGLIKPVFTETVRVKYVWYDDLVAKLEKEEQSQAHASGFPGDRNDKHIDLKNVPKVKSKAAKKEKPKYFNRV